MFKNQHFFEEERFFYRAKCPLSLRYQSYGKDQKVTSLSSGASGGSSQTAFLNFKQVRFVYYYHLRAFLTPWFLTPFDQVKEADIGKKEKADYFNSHGHIVYLKRENFLYKVILYVCTLHQPS